MAIRVSPTEEFPTHHLSLTNGTDTLGLILSNGRGEIDARGIKQSGYPRSVTRISQGVSGYSDFELPYSPTVQSDFSGGRGLEDLEKDTTRFFDSLRADTTRGDVICGPLEHSSMGGTLSVGVIDNNEPVSISDVTPYNYKATKFRPTTSYTAKGAYIMFESSGSAALLGNISVEIYSDNAGTPNASLVAYDIDVSGNQPMSKVFFPFSLALTANTYYWLVIKTSQTDAGAVFDFLLAIAETAVGSSIKNSANGSTWTTLYSDQSLWFDIVGTESDGAIFFEYRGQLYAVINSITGGAPRLMMNGYRGVVRASNASEKGAILTSLDLSSAVLAGNIVKLIMGPGVSEETNWRTIIGNTSTGTNDTITVSPVWNITHSTATEFVILGNSTWTEIAGHGLTKPVTDVMVMDDLVFFAQGESTTIRRGKLTTGTWAWYYDGTDATTGNKATFLKYFSDTQGKKRVWRALGSSVSYAPKPTWATSNSATMTFKTDVICGSSDSKITGIEEYGSPPTLYVMKETGFGSIGGTTDSLVGVYAEHPLSTQIRNVRSENNGRAHMRYDLYLIFSLLDGVESHFDQSLTDVGPNREEGLPVTRRGPIYYLMPYAGRFYACVDGGDTGYSSVLCCTRDGSWHEIYRGPLGRRIRRTYMQVIPGDKVDYLWVSCGSDILYLHNAIDPRKQTGYQYFSGSQVVTSSIYCGFKDVKKYFHELTIFAEGLTAYTYITAEYQTDNEIETNTWHALATSFTTSPSQTIRLSASNNVNGRRIRLRFTLINTGSETPRLKAYRLDGVIRLKPKKMWNVTYVVKDQQHDLQGLDQSGLTLLGVACAWTPENVQTILDNFADSDLTPSPLTMHTLRTMNDNQLVFVEPSSITPLSQVTTPKGELVMVGSFSLLQA